MQTEKLNNKKGKGTNRRSKSKYLDAVSTKPVIKSFHDFAYFYFSIFLFHIMNQEVDVHDSAAEGGSEVSLTDSAGFGIQDIVKHLLTEFKTTVTSADFPALLSSYLESHFPLLSGKITPLWFINKEKYFKGRKQAFSSYKIFTGNYADYTDVIIKESDKEQNGMQVLPCQEFEVLRKLVGVPFFQQLLSIGQTEKTFCMAIKNAGINLREYIEQLRFRVGPVLLVKCLQQLLEGIEVLHSIGYLHNDISLHNIFVDGNKFTFGGLKHAKKIHSSQGQDLPVERLVWRYVGYGTNVYNERVELCMIAYAVNQLAMSSFETDASKYTRLRIDPAHLSSHLRVGVYHVCRMLTLSPYDMYEFTAREVLLHPVFWSPEKAFNFIMLCSDYIDGRKVRYYALKAKQDGTWQNKAALSSMKIAQDSLNALLEQDLLLLFDNKEGWIEKVENISLKSFFGKLYCLTVRSLIAAVRNRSSHHFEDDEAIQKFFRALPDKYIAKWLEMFPQLLIVLAKWALRAKLNEENASFKNYFPVSDDVEPKSSFWAAFIAAPSIPSPTPPSSRTSSPALD